ncbi:MAG: hypothetical protein WCW01_02000 [Gammaproteobacteria bacterium]|jgi:hypothetical protein
MFASRSSNCLFKIPKASPGSVTHVNTKWSECIAYCKIHGICWKEYIPDERSNPCHKIVFINPANNEELSLQHNNLENLVNLLHTFLCEYDMSVSGQNKHPAFSIFASYTPYKMPSTANLSPEEHEQLIKEITLRTELAKVETPLWNFFSKNLPPRLLQVSPHNCSSNNSSPPTECSRSPIAVCSN